MGGQRNHFVPQFYLRAFSTDGRRTCVFSVRAGKCYFDASIRDQCYRRAFYGPDNALEKYLSEVESRVAPITRAINSNSTLPRPYSLEHRLLVLFIALQRTRTLRAAERANEGIDKLMKQVLRENLLELGVGADEFEVGHETPALLALSPAHEMAEAYLDLEMHVIRVDRGEYLITSDHPVFHYNQWCEGIEWSGVGALSRGLQVFLPISPECLLFMYDRRVYAVGAKGERASSVAATGDVFALNTMQAISAHESLYFRDRFMQAALNRVVSHANQLRKANQLQIEELPEQGNEQRASLIHIWESLPSLHLSLSFTRIRRRFRKIKKVDRVNQYRNLPDRSTRTKMRDQDVRIFRRPDRE